MKPRWSPTKAAVVGALSVLGIGLVFGGVLAGVGVFGDHPFRSGEQIGQGLGVVMIAAAALAYFVQRGRIAKDK
jgi:hypothetical protein